MAFSEQNKPNNVISDSVHKNRRTSRTLSNSRTTLRTMQVLLFIWLIADLVAVAVNAQQPVRCFTLCRRSEDDVRCRRCRFREPLRFGKRDPMDSAIDSGNLMQSVSSSVGAASAESGQSSSSSSGSERPAIRELLIKRIRERLLELEPLVTRLAAIRANQDTLNGVVDPL